MRAIVVDVFFLSCFFFKTIQSARNSLLSRTFSRQRELQKNHIIQRPRIVQITPSSSSGNGLQRHRLSSPSFLDIAKVAQHELQHENCPPSEGLEVKKVIEAEKVLHVCCPIQSRVVDENAEECRKYLRNHDPSFDQSNGTESESKRKLCCLLIASSPSENKQIIQHNSLIKSSSNPSVVDIHSGEDLNKIHKNRFGEEGDTNIDLYRNKTKVWRPLSILILSLNNVGTMDRNGTYDIRHETLLPMSQKLTKMGHHVRFHAFIRRKETLTKEEYGEEPERYVFTSEERDLLTQKEKIFPDLAIVAANHVKGMIKLDRAFYKIGKQDHKLIVDMLQERKNKSFLPTMFCQHGMLYQTVTIDPKGQLGDSFYVDNVNDIVQKNWTSNKDKECKNRIFEELKVGSKRPQRKAETNDDIIFEKPFIFAPTQKFHDVSVEKHASIKYPEMLEKLCLLMSKEKLNLVIKIHPHVRGEHLTTQENLIRSLQAN